MQIKILIKLFYQAYENYSFEELRFTAPAPKRASETMLVRANGDGTYAATWTPGSVGWYAVKATVDGYEIDQVTFKYVFICVQSFLL